LENQLKNAIYSSFFQRDEKLATNILANLISHNGWGCFGSRINNKMLSVLLFMLKCVGDLAAA